MRLQLSGTWILTVSTGYRAEATLRADGTCSRTDIGKCQWRIEGTTLLLGSGDNDDKFQLPISDGKLEGINHLGNTLNLTKK